MIIVQKILDHEVFKLGTRRKTISQISAIQNSSDNSNKCSDLLKSGKWGSDFQLFGYSRKISNNLSIRVSQNAKIVRKPPVNVLKMFYWYD